MFLFIDYNKKLLSIRTKSSIYKIRIKHKYKHVYILFCVSNADNDIHT